MGSSEIAPLSVPVLRMRDRKRLECEMKIHLLVASVRYRDDVFWPSRASDLPRFLPPVEIPFLLYPFRLHLRGALDCTRVR